MKTYRRSFVQSKTILVALLLLTTQLIPQSSHAQAPVEDLEKYVQKLINLGVYDPAYFKSHQTSILMTLAAGTATCYYSTRLAWKAHQELLAWKNRPWDMVGHFYKDVDALVTQRTIMGGLAASSFGGVVFFSIGELAFIFDLNTHAGVALEKEITQEPSTILKYVNEDGKLRSDVYEQIAKSPRALQRFLQFVDWLKEASEVEAFRQKAYTDLSISKEDARGRISFMSTLEGVPVNHSRWGVTHQVDFDTSQNKIQLSDIHHFVYSGEKEPLKKEELPLSISIPIYEEKIDSSSFGKIHTLDFPKIPLHLEYRVREEKRESGSAPPEYVGYLEIKAYSNDRKDSLKDQKSLIAFDRVYVPYWIPRPR